MPNAYCLLEEVVMVALKALHRKRTRIGLDIGVSGIRAVQLTRSADGYEVTNAACGDRPSEPGAQATGQDPAPATSASSVEPLGVRIPPLLPRQIEECLGRGSFHGKAVAAALSPPDVEFHTLELPAAALRAEEVEAAQIVRFEVERLMTTTHAPVETRHWRLPPTSVPAPNAMGTGAAHDIIDATLEVCARAGFTCTDLDTTATALTRLGTLLQSRPKDQVWGILDVGDRQARLVLCLDDTPILVRTAGAGGRIWTQHIADALQVSFKAAEIHKRDHGIALTGRQSRSTAQTPLPPPLVRGELGGLPPYQEGKESVRSELASLILGALRADLNDLASEIKRSYEYVLGCYPGRGAADLVLCGGGSLLRHFPEFLGSTLGIPVRRASSYLQGESCRLRFPAEHSTPLEVLAVGVGLSIAEPEAEETAPQRGTEAENNEGQKGRRALTRTSNFVLRTSVNLIPESVQAAQVRRRHFKRWAACLIVTSGVAVVPVITHGMQHIRLEELQATSDKLQIDLAAARAELKTATAEANDAFLRIERAKALRTKRGWSNMLAFIGGCLPKDCWLTSIATDPEVPSAAPLARKAPPPSAIPATDAAVSLAGKGALHPASPLGKGGIGGSDPAMVIIDTPRKLRMIGEATDATQPLSFVTKLKESQVFREVTLERSINTSPHGARTVGLTRENSGDESNFRFELICEW